MLIIESLPTINYLTVIKYIVYYYLFMTSLNILRQKLQENSKTLMIVLGSGGHTGELLIMLQKLNLDKFSLIVFVSSHNDVRSEGKAREVLKVDSSNESKIRFYKVYRSRNVGQSFFSSIFTTIYAMMHSVYIIAKTRPNMIVTNGPGVALPLVYIGFVLRKLKVLFEFKILFIESYCRTKSVSLAGKLIQPVADRFIVLWEDIASSKREYLGKII